jgi:hypothetical protein
MTLTDSGHLLSRSLEASIRRGADAVVAEGDAIHALADSMPDLPITARWPWIRASVTKPNPGCEPWLVALHADNELVGAAVLIDDTTGSVRRTSLAGTAEEHRGALLAISPEIAADLGEALARALLADLREFSIGPVAGGTAVSALLQCLPIGVLVDDVAVPVVHAAAGLPVGISHGVARTLRKARNRMMTDGVQSEIAITNDRSEITTMLPLLESISRDRDIAAGRVCPLDDPGGRRLWQRRMRALAGDGVLQLATLWLDGDLAAFVLGVDDEPVYRILGGRYVSRWARYAPGRVLEAAVLDSVVESEKHVMLDWMVDVASETLLARNGVDPLVVIRGRT